MSKDSLGYEGRSLWGCESSWEAGSVEGPHKVQMMEGGYLERAEGGQ